MCSIVFWAFYFLHLLVFCKSYLVVATGIFFISLAFAGAIVDDVGAGLESRMRIAYG